MIQTNNVEDNTKNIREKKHSKKLKENVEKMVKLKEENPDVSSETLESECSFLFYYYTDIFNKIKKNEIDLQILWKLLNVLERIENEELDQHDGSYEVGKILKEL